METPADANPLVVLLIPRLFQALHDEPANHPLLRLILLHDGELLQNLVHKAVVWTRSGRSRIRRILRGVLCLCMLSLGSSRLFQERPEELRGLPVTQIICVRQDVVADREEFHEVTRRIGSRVLLLPVIIFGDILEDCGKGVGRQGRLRLPVEDPALLSCHRLVIDIIVPVCVARIPEAAPHGLLAQHPAPQDPLLLVGQGDIGAHDMHAVLEFPRGLIGARAKCDEEAEFSIVLHAKEELDAFQEFVDEGLDHVQAECARHRRVFGIPKVQVDEQGLRLRLARLLYKTHTAAALYKEIVVEEVQELGIVLVRDEPTPCRAAHSRHGGRPGIFRHPRLQKTAQGVSVKRLCRHICIHGESWFAYSVGRRRGRNFVRWDLGPSPPG